MSKVLSEVIDVPIGANRNAPLRMHVVPGVPGEIGKAIVVHDTNGVPVLRFALNVRGEWTLTPFCEIMTLPAHVQVVQ
jgi:hypothetical protein